MRLHTRSAALLRCVQHAQAGVARRCRGRYARSAAGAAVRRRSAALPRTRLQVLADVLGVRQAEDGVDAVEVAHLLVDEERLAGAAARCA